MSSDTLPRSTVTHRPVGVTILAVLAGVLAFFAVIHTLQALAILPYFIGSFVVRDFDLFYAIMWALMVWIYYWLIRMLWRVDEQGWMFLVVVAILNLLLDFAILIGAETWSDVSVSFIVNALILGYCMIPSVREAFDVR